MIVFKILIYSTNKLLYVQVYCKYNFACLMSPSYSECSIAATAFIDNELKVKQTLCAYAHLLVRSTEHPYTTSHSSPSPTIAPCVTVQLMFVLAVTVNCLQVLRVNGSFCVLGPLLFCTSIFVFCTLLQPIENVLFYC